MSDAVEEWHQNHSENEGQPAAVVLEVWHVTQDQDHKEEGQAVNQVPHTFVVGPGNKVASVIFTISVLKHFKEIKKLHQNWVTSDLRAKINADFF